MPAGRRGARSGGRPRRRARRGSGLRQAARKDGGVPGRHAGPDPRAEPADEDGHAAYVEVVDDLQFQSPILIAHQ